MNQSNIFLKSFKIFLTKTLIVVSIFVSVLYAGVKVYAVYYPTDNITNPACAPGASGCYVSLLPDQTSNAGSLLFTNGSNPVWSTPSSLNWDSTENTLTVKRVLRLGNNTVTPNGYGSAIFISGAADYTTPNLTYEPFITAQPFGVQFVTRVQRANGTPSAPTAVLAGQTQYSIQTSPYGTSGYSTSINNYIITSLADATTGNAPAVRHGFISSAVSADTGLFVYPQGVLIGNNITSYTTTPGARLDISGANSTSTLGSEMIIATADRDLSSDTGNWTGSNWTVGSGVITHTAGAADVLTLSNTALSSTPASGVVYQVTFTVNTTTAGTLTPSIGGVNGVVVGQLVASISFTQIITTTGTGPLTFTPDTTWSGTIDNVSVKLVTISTPAQIIRHSDLTTAIEIRSGGIGLNNTFFGVNAGRTSLSADNTAFGYNSLQSNTTGNQNTAFGSIALQRVTTGARNVAVGSFSLQSNVLGAQNTAIGHSSLNALISGDGNTALGRSALEIATSASNNTIIGYRAGDNITTGSNNIILGRVKAPSATDSNQLSIGNIIFGIKIDGASSTLSTGSIGIGSYNKLSRFTVTAPADTTNIGGTTVSSSATTIIGVGTTFTTSLGIGDRISLSSASSTYATVTAIASDTSLTVDTALGNGTSQTINLKKSIFRLDDASNTTKMVMNDLGNVGIGTTNPGTTLDILGSSARIIRYNTSVSGPFILLDHARGTSTSPSIVTSSDELGKIYFLGYDGSKFDNAARIQGVVDGTAGVDDMPGRLEFYTTPDGSALEQLRMVIKNDGNLGIGTTSPSYKLHVGDGTTVGIIARFQNSTGTCDINPTTTALSCSSDRNLKTNITNINNNILSNITSLQPVTYNWISDTTGPTQTGFIAQDVEAIFPNLVSTDPNTNLKSLNYIGLIPYTVEGIKELNLKIDGIASLDVSNGNSMGYLMKSFLESAANNIGVVFFGEVHAKKLCSSSGNCLSEEQFNLMIEEFKNTHSAPSNPAPIQNEVPPVVENLDNNTPDNNTPDNSGTPVELPTE